MLEAFWIPLIPPFFIGLLLSWAMESLLQPRPQAPWNRPLAANLTHIGVWTLAFALELALFRRPYFAVANVLAIQLLLVLVSRAKYQALQEPFVYPDFEYFTDAIKHPRLYLPFFGWKNALASGGGYGLALWAGLTFEDSVTAGAGIWLVSFADLPQESVFDATAPVVPFFMHAAALASIGLCLALFAGRTLAVAFDAVNDLRRLGMVAALWAYRRAESLQCEGLLAAAPFAVGPVVNKVKILPDLVSVQSESFFDIRREYKLVKRDVLAEFDALCGQAHMHGELDVAARGANTVRTEFAFLAGVEANTLGVHQFNPYRRLAQQGVPSLAGYLRSLGYRTICVHPYHGEFYRRNAVIPALGFDEFHDISYFEGADRAGAYISDKAVAEYVQEIIRNEDSGPLYIHVITMENHGPLHWESVTERDAQEVLVGPAPENCGELVAYAKHLKNADAMFALLKSALHENDRPAALCIYGDHVPIMKAYEQLGEPKGTTNYLIWGTSQAGSAKLETRMAVESLADAFLSVAGLKNKEWEPALKKVRI